MDLPDFVKESVPQIQILCTFQARLTKTFALFRHAIQSLSKRSGRRARQKETPAEAGVVNSLEARPGFEPGIKALQASALPLGHLAKDDV